MVLLTRSPTSLLNFASSMVGIGRLTIYLHFKGGCRGKGCGRSKSKGRSQGQGVGGWGSGGVGVGSGSGGVCSITDCISAFQRRLPRQRLRQKQKQKHKLRPRCVLCVRVRVCAYEDTGVQKHFDTKKKSDTGSCRQYS